MQHFCQAHTGFSSCPTQLYLMTRMYVLRTTEVEPSFDHQDMAKPKANEARIPSAPASLSASAVDVTSIISKNEPLFTGSEIVRDWR